VNASTTNTYDAFDKLVETSAGPTQFLYLPGGTQPFATMSNYQTYLKVFAPAPGGAMVITPNGNEGVVSYHRHTDWIGSSRFATTPAETVYFDGAYAPFGEPYATRRVAQPSAATTTRQVPHPSRFLRRVGT